MIALLVVVLASSAGDPAERARLLLTQEQDVVDALDTLYRQLADVGRAHREARQKLEDLEANLTRLKTEEAAVAEVLGRQRERLSARLRGRTRLDAMAVTRILLDADEPTDLVRRRHYLRRILAADLELLRGVRQAHRLRTALLTQLRSVEAEIRGAEAELGARHASLRGEREVRAEVLATVRRERRLLDRLLSGRDRARRRLEESLPEDAQGDGGFARQRGRVAWPVRGRVIRGFGTHEDVELGTETFHKGLAIDAKPGASVRACFGGQVVYSGWYKGFGNLVIIDHGDGFHSLYAHLQAISKARGESVLEGAVVGEAGDTGSLGGPMLYFEIRKQGKPVDPLKWLRR